MPRVRTKAHARRWASRTLEGFSDQQALLAFGEHYRHVLETPKGSDHGNIRNLMAHGLAGVAFAAPPLTRV